MRTTTIARVTFLILFPFVLSLADEVPTNLTPSSPVPAPDVTKINVFFGTVKVLSVNELRTNAVELLKMKGYAVPDSAKCVINISVKGPDPGCVVMFRDVPTKMIYQVSFNRRGQVSEVWSGPSGHGTPAPNDPRPKVPKGAVPIKP